MSGDKDICIVVPKTAVLDEHKLAQKIVSSVLKRECSLISVDLGDPLGEAGAINIAFGHIASAWCNSYKLEFVSLPALSRLTSGKENEAARLAAYRILVLLDRYINSSKTNSVRKFQTDQDVPLLDIEEIKKLEYSLRDQHLNEWKCRTSSGKEILLCLKPPEKTTIPYITLRELFVMRTAQEVLDIESFQLV